LIQALLAFTSLLSAAPGAYAAPGLEYSDADTIGTVENERFPVLCYHGVNLTGAISVSPQRLRYDLEMLYDCGFFLVTPDDLEEGLVQVPEGRSPLMLTFDDGWQDQFDIVTSADGGTSISSQCALGILEEFCADHPEFGRGAVFFISWDKIPFGQPGLLEEKLNFLLDHGYCIGNHTLRHSSFMSLPREGWDEAIDGSLARFRPLIGLRTSGVTALSWPGGRLPKGTDVDEAILSITWEGAPAVRMGFVVDGDLASLGGIADGDGRLRISRVDMGRFTMGKLLQMRGLIVGGLGRTSLHDPLPPDPAPLSPLRLD
jgi:hypothetical protein